MGGDCASLHGHLSICLLVQDCVWGARVQNLEIKASKGLAVAWIFPLSDLIGEERAAVNVAWQDEIHHVCRLEIFTILNRARFGKISSLLADVQIALIFDTRWEVGPDEVASIGYPYGEAIDGNVARFIIVARPELNIA